MEKDSQVPHYWENGTMPTSSPISRRFRNAKQLPIANELSQMMLQLSSLALRSENYEDFLSQLFLLCEKFIHIERLYFALPSKITAEFDVKYLSKTSVITDSPIIKFDSALPIYPLLQDAFSQVLACDAAYSTSCLSLQKKISLNERELLLISPVLNDTQALAVIAWQIPKQGIEKSQAFELLALVANHFAMFINKLTYAAEIKRRKRIEKTLTFKARHDALTGLPNRVVMLDRLSFALAHQHRNKQYLFALLFIDIDHFKLVNDTYGHLVGDALIQQVSTKLLACIRKNDTLARFGGDEFTLLLDGLCSEKDAEGIAKRINLKLSEGFLINGEQHQLSASIGIHVCYPADQHNVEEIIGLADEAMYQAKQFEKGGFIRMGID